MKMHDFYNAHVAELGQRSDGNAPFVSCKVTARASVKGAMAGSRSVTLPSKQVLSETHTTTRSLTGALRVCRVSSGFPDDISKE